MPNILIIGARGGIARRARELLEKRSDCTFTLYL